MTDNDMSLKKLNDKFRKILLNAEFKLVMFLSYVGSLIYAWLIHRQVLHILYAHLIFVFIFSIFYFGVKFVFFIFSPLISLAILADSYVVKKYLRNFKQNVPVEVVIVLGHTDWFKLQAWIKPNFLKSEIEALVRYLKLKKQDFSFYTEANYEDVESIMRNTDIKEVYFFGHGDSHTFKINTDEVLYYCDFNNTKYGKEFIHQVHCGTPHGKSLIDYVVPAENRSKCFIIRRPINSYEIVRELKRRSEI